MFYRTLWQTILQGNVWRGELINNRKNGTNYFEEMTITPVKDKQGRITNFIAIKQNVSQRKQYLSEIEQSRKQLRALTSHLQRIRENERAKIARELHDEFGQQITALKLTLELIRQKMQKSLPEKSTRSLNENIKSMGAHIDKILEEVKEMVGWLRPKALDNLGLTSAIEWHLEEFHNRTGIRYVLEIDDDLPALNQVQDVAIFRIVQETLTNVSRHAEASEVWVTINVQEEQLYLTVRDNGIGMDPDSRDRLNSFGILGMRERAADFGGHLSIVSEPYSGTEVILKLPLE
ncbi:MAG: histidine kinase [Calditrichota bacterium]